MTDYTPSYETTD